MTDHDPLSRSDVWLVVGQESGLRRIEQASGGPVVHYIDATENQVEVVTRFDHEAAVAEAEKRGIVRGQLSSLTTAAQDEIRFVTLDAALEVVESFDWSPNTGMDFGCGDVTDAINALRVK